MDAAFDRLTRRAQEPPEPTQPVTMIFSVVILALLTLLVATEPGSDHSAPPYLPAGPGLPARALRRPRSKRWDSPALAGAITGIRFIN